MPITRLKVKRFVFSDEVFLERIILRVIIDTCIITATTHFYARTHKKTRKGVPVI